MNLAKKGQLHFSFFKVDSQNPKFNLEYLEGKKVDGRNKLEYKKKKKISVKEM